MATINDIKAYVRETPYNTNPNVLDSLLDSLETGGDSSIIIATLSEDEQTGDLICDKTYEELSTALAANKEVYFKNDGSVSLLIMSIKLLYQSEKEGDYIKASLGEGYELTIDQSGVLLGSGK